MILTKSYGLQKETKQYLKRLYAYNRVLEYSDIIDIDNFIDGCKQFRFWDRMIAFDLRSSHNIGSGSNALSFGGLENPLGILVNSPTWSNNGLSLKYSPSLQCMYALLNKDYVYSHSASLWCTGAGDGGPQQAFYQLWLLQGGYNTLSQSLMLNDSQGGGNVMCAAGPINISNGRTNNIANPYHNSTLFSNTIATLDTYNSILRVNNLRSSTSATLAINSTNVTKPLGFDLPNRLQLGGRWSGSAYSFGVNMTISFCALFSSSLISDNLIFADLYKTTIGKGLGLP